MCFKRDYSKDASCAKEAQRLALRDCVFPAAAVQVAVQLQSYYNSDNFTQKSQVFTMSPSRAVESDWLSLQRASHMLGVHPATLRLWADQGKIRSTRTAGGHRRFALKDVQAFAARQGADAGNANAQLIMHSALGRARIEVAGGRANNQTWFRLFDDQSREHQREMGRELLGLMMQYINAAGSEDDEQSPRARILLDAQKLGAEYGRNAARQGLSLSDAMRAFLFFRDFMLESVVQMREVAAGNASDATMGTYRLINGFANEVLIAMVTAYQAAGS